MFNYACVVQTEIGSDSALKVYFREFIEEHERLKAFSQMRGLTYFVSTFNMLYRVLILKTGLITVNDQFIGYAGFFVTIWMIISTFLGAVHHKVTDHRKLIKTLKKLNDSSHNTQIRAESKRLLQLAQQYKYILFRPDAQLGVHTNESIRKHAFTWCGYACTFSNLYYDSVKLGGKWTENRQKCPKVKEDPINKLFLPYDQNRLYTTPNSTLASASYFDKNGKQISLSQLQEKLRPQKGNSKHGEVFNPGLDMSKAGLHFAEINDKMLLDTVMSRVFGNRIDYNPKVMKKYLKIHRRLVRELKQKIKLAFLNTEIQTIEEFIESKTGKKKAELVRAYENLKTTNHIKSTMTLEMKKYEQQFTTKVRGRVICSPPKSLNLPLVVINAAYIKVLKSLPELGFCSGLNLTELANAILQQKQTIGDSVLVTEDTSQFDSTQWDVLIKTVDVPLVKMMIRLVGERLSWDDQLIENVIKIVGKTDYNFIIRYLDGSGIMAKGRTKGGVMSGISTLTTVGNSLREHLDAKNRCIQAKIPDNQWKGMFLGDDKVVIVNKKYQEEYVNKVKELTTADGKPKVHGLGRQCKELYISEDYSSFLSKDIFILPGWACAYRKIPRAILGGNVSTKIGKVSQEEFNHCITRQLEEGHANHPFLSSYIQYRKDYLKSTFVDPINMDDTYQYKEYLYRNPGDVKENWDILQQYQLRYEQTPTTFTWDEYFITHQLDSLKIAQENSMTAK